jgi:hypothetical protein
VIRKGHCRETCPDGTDAGGSSPAVGAGAPGDHVPVVAKPGVTRWAVRMVAASLGKVG